MLRDLLSLLLALPLFLAARAPAAEPPSLLSEAEAREEVLAVAEAILRIHPDPFHATPRQELLTRVHELAQRRGDVPVWRQYFDLRRLTRLVYDTHTQVHVTAETPGFDRTFPLRFRIFADGLYLIAGSDDYRAAVGRKIVAIDGREPDDVLNELVHYGAGDHDLRNRVFAESFLYLPETYELLRPVGGVERLQTPTLTLEDADGGRTTLELSATWERGPHDFGFDALNPFLPAELVTAHEALGGTVPLYQRRIADPYWFTFLDGGRCLYLQINFPFVEEGFEQPLDFHLRWLEALRRSQVEVLVVDLRNDPGGMIRVTDPVAGLLSLATRDHPTLQATTVLLGLDTVSAGVILAAQLEDAVGPVLVGEPAGSAPNMFLDAENFVLPYSRLQVDVSRRPYVTTVESDRRPYLAPDIEIEASFAEWLAGRDPVLEAARAVDRETRDGVYAGTTPYDRWTRASQRGLERRAK